MNATASSGRGAVTLHDVAREAGVSLATASRVLNGSTRKVADSYRVRVEAAAEKLGYTANLSAQATARGSAAIVALLVSDITDPYVGHVAAGVATGAHETGMLVTIAITGRDPDRAARLVRAIRGQRPRGLLLAGWLVPSLRSELEAFTQTGGRVVTVGPNDAGYDMVTVDNAGGGRHLAGELAALGYRDAVIVATDESNLVYEDRVTGFTEGFEAGGGTVRRVVRAELSREGAYRAAEQLVADGLDEGTLVFGVSDVMAIGVASAVRDAGRQVGRDIAVAGFDDIAPARDIGPGLTTVHVPLEDLGYRGLRRIVDPEGELPAPSALEVVVRPSTPPRV